MLQQAFEASLRGRGWAVDSEGHVLRATREDSELVIGFVGPGEASAFAELCEGSPASLAAVLMGAVSDADVVHLEESGVACFPQKEVEDFVLASWLDPSKIRSSSFAQFLEEL